MDNKTVAQLKDICRGYGLKVSGLKAELIQRIQDYESSSMSGSSKRSNKRRSVRKSRRASPKRRSARKERRSARKSRRVSSKRRSARKERRSARKERRSARKSRRASPKKRSARKERRSARKIKRASPKKRSARKERRSAHKERRSARRQRRYSPKSATEEDPLLCDFYNTPPRVPSPKPRVPTPPPRVPTPPPRVPTPPPRDACEILYTDSEIKRKFINTVNTELTLNKLRGIFLLRIRNVFGSEAPKASHISILHASKLLEKPLPETYMIRNSFFSIALEILKQMNVKTHTHELIDKVMFECLFKTREVDTAISDAITQFMVEYLLYSRFTGAGTGAGARPSGRSIRIQDALRTLELDVNGKYTTSDINKQFRVLSLKYHPDKLGGSPTKQQTITNARDIIIDAINNGLM